MLKPWGLDLPKAESVGAKRKRPTASSSFQLPMRGHTSYLTFAVKKLDDEASFPKPVLSLAKITKLAESVAQGREPALV
jgi:hypothetical protein